MSDIEDIRIELLVFDKENPRLPSSVRGGDESKILNYLARKTGIESLMSSIGANGFFRGEALVAMPEESKYVVIEGNRRLAALRLLQNPSLVKLQSIDRAARRATEKPSSVPVHIVQAREDTIQYLGFRHITGVQRWDPLAKARYLESLFRLCDGDPQTRYMDVSREIGSTSTTIRRNLDALAAYRLVEAAEFYDIEDVDEESFQFGTFYTAVSNTDIGDFVGTRDQGNPTHPICNPTVIGRESLKELVKYMFERDADGNTVLGESRNIGKLGTVLTNPDSLEALRLGQSLDAAYRLTPHGHDDFMRHINRAIEQLKQANANLYAVELDDKRAINAVSEAVKVLQLPVDRLGIRSDA